MKPKQEVFQPRPYKPVWSFFHYENGEPRGFHLSKATTRCIIGPRGSGKSTGIVWDIWFHASSMRPLKGTNIRSSEWAFVAATHDRIRSTAIKEWMFWFGQITEITYGVQVTGRVSALLSDGTVVQMNILFSAADDLQSAGKFKSVQLTGVWLVEAAEFRTMDVYNMIFPCVGRWPAPVDGGPSWQGILMDTNSMSIDHWWPRMQLEVKPYGWEFFSQPPALFDATPFNPEAPEYVPNEGQNPNIRAAENVENLSGGFGYYYGLAASMTREWIKVFVQNQFGKLASSRPVYPEYNDSVHAKTGLQLYRGIPLRLGFDWGRTPCCVICQLDSHGQWRCLEEVCGKGISVQNFVKMQLAPILLKRYSGMEIIAAGDPAGFDKEQATDGTCAAVLKEIGIDVQPAPTNKFIPRRESVATMLQSPGAFVLDPAMCPTLRDGFLGAYHLNDKGEVEKDDPSSHPHDGLAAIALFSRVNPQVKAQQWSAANYYGAQARRELGFGQSGSRQLVNHDGTWGPVGEAQAANPNETPWPTTERNQPAPGGDSMDGGGDPAAWS